MAEQEPAETATLGKVPKRTATTEKNEDKNPKQQQQSPVVKVGKKKKALSDGSQS